jgi:adenylate kinase
MILLYGPPGSGKSVQGQLLAAHHDWRWLSTGQLLRDTHDEDVMRQMLTKGVVDNKAVYRILIEALREANDVNRVILDGFPRSIDQAHWLIAALPEHRRSVAAVVNLEVPFEETLRRLQLRGRVDDKKSVIEKRYQDYINSCEEVFAYFKANHVPVVHINGIGEVEDVYAAVDKAIEKCIQK